MMPETMKGYVFHGIEDARLEELPIPRAPHREAVIKVTLTTICTTDIHILDGDFRVTPGLVLGHEFVGEIYELAPDVESCGYKVGDRVAVTADTPCGYCDACLSATNGRGCRENGSVSGFQIGCLRNGAHAEYVCIPSAAANMAKIPNELTDEQVLLTGDVLSTGFAAPEMGGVTYGDTVVIYGQGPIGLAATQATHLRGAALIITVDSFPKRIEMSKRYGADIVINYQKDNPVEEISRITGGRMADVAIEVVGKQESFENALRSCRVGGTVSSMGNYGNRGSLTLPLDAWWAGNGDITIFGTASPGGKDRSRRIMEMIRHKKIDFMPLISETFTLDEIDRAYDLYRASKDKVFKVAIKP
jgi:threonine dehydrogenase-like Zn-dependent dehydrogenase